MSYIREEEATVYLPQEPVRANLNIKPYFERLPISSIESIVSVQFDGLPSACYIKDRTGGKRDRLDDIKALR